MFISKYFFFFLVCQCFFFYLEPNSVVLFDYIYSIRLISVCIEILFDAGAYVQFGTAKIELYCDRFIAI